MMAVQHQIKLLVGLGNPGVQYARNRHNLGFMVLDHLAERLGAHWQTKTQQQLAESRTEHGKLWLLKPQTYMNLSGAAVAPFVAFHKLEPESVLVVHDDLDLPFGRLRLRLGGSSGGQNGVTDIAAHLGSDRFARLKLGISRPPTPWTVPNWVLSNFSKEESDLLEQVIKAGVDAALLAQAQGVHKAQAEFNGLDLRPKPAAQQPETSQPETPASS